MTDAIDKLNKTQRVFAREFTGKRYDVGDKFGFMKTSIDYALQHPQVKEDLKKYLIDLGHKLEGKPEQKTNIKSIEKFSMDFSYYLKIGKTYNSH